MRRLKYFFWLITLSFVVLIKPAFVDRVLGILIQQEVQKRLSEMIVEANKKYKEWVLSEWEVRQPGYHA